jgi:predicted nucleic acid binding AN1-type Zn finger protein
MSLSRCFLCKKKEIILVDCYCKNSYCLKHRMPEDHMCNFDYIKKGKDDLTQLNPKIVSDKMEKV